MAVSEGEMIKILEQYVENLRKRISVEKVILFGSYANGTATDRSDIDLAVITKELENDNLNLFDFYVAVGSAAWEVEPSIEAVTYAPEDFEHYERGSFVDEIIRTGKVIYERKNIHK
jgi:predicted nucleotidyltransferase